MKKTLLSLSFFLAFIYYSKAQTLYGTTFYGGNDNGGEINKFLPATNDLTISVSFENFAANPYYTNLIQSTDGKLYGMTFNGGKNNNGIIFSFDPSSKAYLKLKDFDNSNGEGSSPSGSLIQAKDGLMYGMTSFGGSSNAGIIFSFNPTNNNYIKLYDFDNSNGANPQGSLIQAADGKLYGLANGGDNNYGIIFSYDPVFSTFTKLYEFDNINGAYPQGSLMQANDNKLYGLASNGGSSSLGVIFSYDLSTFAYTKLKDFNDANGGYPYGNLIQASNGKLYGMAFGGGGGYGFIFSYDFINSSYEITKNFDSTSGGNPFGSLIQASDNKLYGMTSDGGGNNVGTIFSYDVSTSSYNKLKDFDNVSGNGPFGSLMQASDGKLYGLTFQGGSSNDGVIFSFDVTTNVNYTKLKDFAANEKGRNTSSGLIRATDKKLYGMTFSGGSNNNGTIFSYDPSTLTYAKLKDFDSTNGINPYGGLIQATDGKLYGMTTYGGKYGLGVIFSFDPITFQYIKLKDFNDTSGALPYGSLMQASDGKLYGTTYIGGKNEYGVIFSFDPATGIYRKKDFNYTDGAYPYGNLVQAGNGLLYGIAYDGGNGRVIGTERFPAGVIFSFDPQSLVYTRLHDLDYYNDGAFGYSSFIQAKDGKLYSMNVRGGTFDEGVIFYFDPATSAVTQVYSFDVTNGSAPYGNLMQASDGKLYGMTHEGGDNNVGVIFSYDPALSNYSKLIDYTESNGANPYYNSGFVEVPEQGPLLVTLLNFTGKNHGSSNLLSWKVANQQKVDYYQLERSINGLNFLAVSQIANTGVDNYFYNDDINTASSVYYYRLKSVDIDGNFVYSKIVKLIRENNANFAFVNPNPFKSRLVITIESPIQDKAAFIITDITGKKLYEGNKQLYQGTNVVVIDETNTLSKGTYLLTIITSRQSHTIKVVKGN